MIDLQSLPPPEDKGWMEEWARAHALEILEYTEKQVFPHMPCYDHSCREGLADKIGLYVVEYITKGKFRISKGPIGRDVRALVKTIVSREVKKFRCPLRERREQPRRLPLTWEDQEAVRAAIQSLPPRYQEVIDLRWYEGLNTQEIAQRLGTTVPAIKGLLNKAKVRLEELLRPDYGSPEPPPKDRASGKPADEASQASPDVSNERSASQRSQS